MIGESVPDQPKQAIAQLAAQIDHFIATGQRIKHIEQGVSANAPLRAPQIIWKRSRPRAPSVRRRFGRLPRPG